MPYKSAAQRGYLHKFKPRIAARWDKEEKDRKRKDNEQALRRRLKR